MIPKCNALTADLQTGRLSAVPATSRRSMSCLTRSRCAGARKTVCRTATVLDRSEQRKPVLKTVQVQLRSPSGKNKRDFTMVDFNSVLHVAFYELSFLMYWYGEQLVALLTVPLLLFGVLFPSWKDFVISTVIALLLWLSGCLLIESARVF